MKPLRAFLFYKLVLACILFVSSCSGATSGPVSGIALVGSTPGDELIKFLLTIPPNTKVDFIRWRLTLTDRKPDQGAFELHILFGESKPNTLGFSGGGERLSFEGTYTVSQSKNGRLNGEILHLKSSRLSGSLSMVKLSDNLFHLLTPQNRLMVGNGGWSYTLTREEPVHHTAALPALTASSTLANDTWRQVTFDGRTPCQGFAAEHRMNVSPSCFKLKWRLVLNRNPLSLKPTTYTIRKVVDNSPRDVSGKWAIIKGTRESPEATVYQLDPDDPENSISLLVGDENVLFFLDGENKLYDGNGDFSFTLNRRRP